MIKQSYDLFLKKNFQLLYKTTTAVSFEKGGKIFKKDAAPIQQACLISMYSYGQLEKHLQNVFVCIKIMIGPPSKLAM